MKPQLNEELREEVQRRIARSAAFQRVFNGKDGEFVLAEMKKQISGFDPNPYINAYNCGMRDFYNFVNNILTSDVEKAMEVLNAGNPEKRKP